MSLKRPVNWSDHVDQIVRSRHYTWLGEGQAGEDPSDAMASILTDIRHICRQEGLSFDALLERSRRQSDREETELALYGEPVVSV